MKTTVLGIRLTDYQLEQLKAKAGEELVADVVRSLINDYIDGRYAYLGELKRKADIMGVSLQSLIDKAENDENEE
jgi:hypothetical protein